MHVAIAAAAVIAREGAGYRVVSIQQALPGYRLPDVNAARATAARLGAAPGTLRLEWSSSASTRSPFLPLWVAGDGATTVRFDQRREVAP